MEQMNQVHILKTGSLFQWCMRAPFLAAGISSPKIHVVLRKLGEILGLLLQRSDDLLDFDIRNGEQKNVMGDLRAGYTNSFCAFLFYERTEVERQQLSRTTDLQQFKTAIGESYFVKKLEQFDELNRQLIDDYQKTLSQLASHLSGDVAKSLVEVLAQLPQPIYWRGAP
jgi:octaprenyl-diphosphate synthase